MDYTWGAHRPDVPEAYELSLGATRSLLYYFTAELLLLLFCSTCLLCLYTTILLYYNTWCAHLFDYETTIPPYYFFAAPLYYFSYCETCDAHLP